MSVNYVIPSLEEKKTRWNNMFTRCYNSNYHKRSPKYKDCTICDEWFNNKRLFYDWMDENYYTYGNEQIDLDKDILVRGNKIYSPYTCVFVPHSINTYFEDRNSSVKPKHNLKQNTWSVSMRADEKSIIIDGLQTKQEAIETYAQRKEMFICEKAEQYKDGIPSAIYKAMINFKVKI